MTSLWHCAVGARGLHDRFLADERERLSLDVLASGSTLAGSRESLRNASVLLRCESQLTTSVALLELDGLARRVILCPPDLDPQHWPYVLSASEADAVASREAPAELAASGLAWAEIGKARAPCDRSRDRSQTEWVLFTSGTTGQPKMVVHTLATLIGAISRPAGPAHDVVWSTFYDIRRYGGLQILLRALVAGGSLVMSARDEPMAAFAERAKDARVSHITGTPSHWRRVILSGGLSGLSPRYVRLSGETADQPILNQLRDEFPDATLAHAFASTEAGVAFEIRDGLAGIPAAMFDDVSGGVELKIQDGTLRIRSPRTALRYLGEHAGPIKDDEGFVNTRDRLELRGERYQFAGRSDAVINVGGLKVYPEEVEAVLNQHRLVRQSLAKARRSPLVGAVVVAEIVLDASAETPASKAVEADILNACRAVLPPHKVPASLRFVPSLAVNAAGKLVRDHA